MMNYRQMLYCAVFAMLTACSTAGKNNSGKLIGALDDGAWKNSEWISVADAPVVTGIVNDGARAADGASWFVSTLTNEREVERAEWMTVGLGVYDLYVNGTLVGDEVLKPGFTHPFKTKRSFTYDITGAFDTRSGATNQLAAQVTPGWWGDKIVTPAGSQGMFGTKCAFRGVLRVSYTDGTVRFFGTNADTWQAGIAGPVKHAAIFDGEVYDAREAQGFLTPERLSRPEINREFQGQIRPNNGAEIYMRPDIALAPVKAYIWQEVTGQSEDAYGKVVIKKEFAEGEPVQVNPGENLVVDFGQNAAAVPEFLFQAEEGTTLHCITSELLNDGNGAKSRGMDGPEGSVHRLNLRIPDTGMMLDYTFAASEKPVSYRPRNTFFGYRFLSITVTGPVTIKQMRSVPVTSVSKEMETGRITTGNELVNKLISNTYWGQLSNYLSVPTDCPQRNERLGWTADTQVFAETGTFFANTSRFFHKWLQDLRDTQSPAGGYPGVAPFAQYGCGDQEMMRLGWADAGVIVPWVVWKQFGDRQVIEESWESMERFMTHVAETKYDHNALRNENGNYQWADWLAREYIRRQFFTPEGKFKTAILNTMQTPALFALKNNILEGEAKERMIARLRQNFKEHDNCLQTGFLGTSILMPTLTENGMSDIAYELLFQRRNPSWLYSVDNGATTIWERWNSYMTDKGMGPRGMNSFNHYAYGCVCEWLWETAAGIAADPSQPGFRRIIMRPVPDRRLGHLTAEYRSAAGLVKSSWKYEGDTWQWTFTVPEGATAYVTLPGETAGREYSPGTYTVSVKL